MESLTSTAAKSLIEAHPRRTLVVRFRKRTTGRMRRMACIYFPEEAEAARFRFDPAAKGLLPVWDVEKGARRFVSLDSVQSIKLSGRVLGPNERRADDRPAKPGRTFESVEAKMRHFFG